MPKITPREDEFVLTPIRFLHLCNRQELIDIHLLLKTREFQQVINPEVYSPVLNP
jgi:ATP adenylyltransferase/5',5'''-P-1,P-4-tetraphosphate phosphorylase II